MQKTSRERPPEKENEGLQNVKADLRPINLIIGELKTKVPELTVQNSTDKLQDNKKGDFKDQTKTTQIITAVP